jgi:hypothetical protein
LVLIYFLSFLFQPITPHPASPPSPSSQNVLKIRSAHKKYQSQSSAHPKPNPTQTSQSSSILDPQSYQAQNKKLGHYLRNNPAFTPIFEMYFFSKSDQLIQKNQAIFFHKSMHLVQNLMKISK